jgi:hypothetical protein
MFVYVARISSACVLLVASNGRCCLWADRQTDSCYFGLAVLLHCQKQLRLHWPAFDLLFLDQRKKSKQKYWKSYYKNRVVLDRLSCGICEFNCPYKHRFVAKIKQN